MEKYLSEMLADNQIKISGYYHNTSTLTLLYDIEINETNYRIIKEHGLYKIYKITDFDTIELCSSGNTNAIEIMIQTIKKEVK